MSAGDSTQLTILAILAKEVTVEVIDADDFSTREELVGKLEELRGLSFLVCTEVPL